MIGKLTGRVDWRGSDQVLIDVGGVGYVVHVSHRTLSALPGPGGMAALYTDLLVREDLLQLFGFPSVEEREWHRLLTSVQGVGAKAALAIQGVLGPAGVARAVLIGDAAAIRKAPGVGPKLAQRVVMELKEKAPALMAMSSDAAPDPVLDDPATGAAEPVARAAAPAAAAPAPSRGAGSARRAAQQAQADALSALTNLGYGASEAATAVAQVAEAATEAGGDETDTSGLIRAALRLLAPKG